MSDIRAADSRAKMEGDPMERKEPCSDLVAERSHALAVLLDELFALSRRLAVLLYAVAKLEEALVPRSLSFRACAASAMIKQA